ncbi:MAG: hypothetical protein Q9183_007751, partial [Haloplaca sp. 2 TL-2023]
MAALFRRLSPINWRPGPQSQNLPYQEKDLEHNAAGDSSIPSDHYKFLPSHKLVKFQNLIGIQSTRLNIPGRPAPNP